MNQVIDDYDRIAKAAQLYIDGGAEGDVSKLTEAFHDDARMFGHVVGSSSTWPLASPRTQPARIERAWCRLHRSVTPLR